MSLALVSAQIFLDLGNQWINEKVIKGWVKATHAT